MRRISIRALLIFIIVVAVGLAALRNANDLLAGLMLLANLAAVGVAVLGAIFSQARERAWWAGFAFFCAGYLSLTVGGCLGETFRPQVVTTPMLRYAYEHINTSAILREEEIKVARLSGMPPPAAPSPNFYEFERMAHSFFALLTGLVGGTVAVGFYARRERGQVDGARPL